MPNRPRSATAVARMPALNVRAIIETFASPEAKTNLSGGADSLNRLVYSANTISTMEEVDEQRPNSLVIVPRHVASSGDIALDLLLRRSATMRISCLVVESGTSSLPAATAQLAANFGIALWREKDLDTLELLSRIEHLVRSPELVGAGVIRSVSESMAQPAKDLGEIVRRLADALGYHTALLGPDGSTIVGATLDVAADLSARLTAVDPGVRDLVFDSIAGQRILATPAFPLVSDPSPFWLAVQVPLGLDSRSSHVFTAMRITSMALSTNLTQTSLAYERDNREVGALLDEILQRAERLTVSDVERATALGWQLFGWHAAVQISAERSFATLPAATISQALMSALRERGVDARPVRRDRTLLFWTTHSTAPQTEERAKLASVVRLALQDAQSIFPGIRLRAGIGEPREGPGGIAQSLEDAELALAFAEAGQDGPVVQRADTMTANNLIRSWVPEGAARNALTTVIGPLQQADPSGNLLSTLAMYLDLESNASETAARLHVHRNTVLLRLERIRELLTLDLGDPGDRLALRIALRLK